MWHMDRTSVVVGKEARERLAEYRDKQELPNYDVALKTLLEEAGV